MRCKYEIYDENEEFFMCDWYGCMWFGEYDNEESHCNKDEGCKMWEE